MADRDGVRWWLRLMLDKRSKDKVQREAQEALDKGTDPKKAKRNVKEVEGSFDRLRKVALKVGAVLASLWVVRQVAQYAKAVFDLGSQVLAVGNQFDTVFGEKLGAQLRARTEDLRLMAGLTRRQSEELLAGAGSMAQGFGMSQEAAADFSEEVLSLSADLASFNNVPTAEAAQLVQSALIGNTEAARSLKINFTALDVQQRALAQTGKESADALTQEEKALAALSVMTERAGPQLGDLNRTQEDSDNVAKQLAGSYQQVKESLAAVFVEGTAGELGLSRLRDLFRDLDQWVRKNSEAIGGFASATISTVGVLLRTVGNLFTFTKNGVEVVIDAITAVFSGATYFLLETANTAIRALNGLISLADKIPGVNIDFRIGTVDAVSYLNMAKAAMGELVDDSVEGGRALIGVGRDWGQWAKDVQGALDAADTAVSKSPAASGAVAPPPSSDGRELPAPTIGMEDSMGQAALPTDTSFPGMLSEDEVSWLENNWERIGQAGVHAAYGVTGAWQDAFTLLFEEGANLGEFMKELGSGMAGALLGGLAEFASGKVAENIAASIEMAAKALGFGAALSPAQASAAWASAAQHAAAATAWSALAGASGAAQGAVAGGGRGGLSGGVPTGARDIGGRLADQQNTAPEVHIYIDPLDPQNPAYQRNVAGAVQYAKERYGDKVRIHGRGSG